MEKFSPPGSSDMMYPLLNLTMTFKYIRLSQKEKRNILKLVVKAHIRISNRGFRKKERDCFPLGKYLWDIPLGNINF